VVDRLERLAALRGTLDPLANDIAGEQPAGERGRRDGEFRCEQTPEKTKNRAGGRDAVARGGALDWALFALGIGALIALTYIVGRKVRAKLAL